MAEEMGQRTGTSPPTYSLECKEHNTPGPIPLQLDQLWVDLVSPEVHPRATSPVWVCPVWRTTMVSSTVRRAVVSNEVRVSPRPVRHWPWTRRPVPPPLTLRQQRLQAIPKRLLAVDGAARAGASVPGGGCRAASSLKLVGVVQQLALRRPAGIEVGLRASKMAAPPVFRDGPRSYD